MTIDVELLANLSMSLVVLSFVGVWIMITYQVVTDR